MSFVHWRIGGRRCRGHERSGTGMEHQVHGVRSLVPPDSSRQTPAVLGLKTVECPRRAAPPIRHTRFPGHLLPEQPETN